MDGIGQPIKKHDQPDGDKQPNGTKKNQKKTDTLFVKCWLSSLQVAPVKNDEEKMSQQKNCRQWIDSTIQLSLHCLINQPFNCPRIANQLYASSRRATKL